MSDQLVELETLAPQIQNAIESRNLKNALGRAADKLSELPRQAQRLDTLARAAIALDVNQNTSLKSSLSEAADVANDIGRYLQAASTPDSLRDISDMLPELTSSLRNLDNAVRQGWATIVQAEFQTLASVGDLLVRIAQTEELGQRLRSIGSEAQSVVERKIWTEELTAEIADLRQKRAVLMAELNLLTDNPEVDAFIRAVTRDVATLAHVTPAVVKWLLQNNALSAFSVRGAN